MYSHTLLPKWYALIIHMENFFISGVYYGKLKSHYHKCYTSSCTVCAMDVNDTVSQIMWLVEEICSVIVLF